MRRRTLLGTRALFVLGPLSVAGIGCGGDATPEPRTAATHSEHREDRPERTIATSSDIGALDEAKVSDTFRSALGDLQRCLSAGAQRNELEGGGIAFLLKIGSDGRVVHAHAEHSTLGDRETEKCMLGVLRHRSWPEPQGGDVGVARNSFDFDMPNDVRPPTDWDSSRVSEVVSSLSSAIARCKRGARGDFTATVYVDPDGAAVTAGIAASDESGEDAADCLTRTLTGAKYPSPGSWPAKVTFSL